MWTVYQAILFKINQRFWNCFTSDILHKVCVVWLQADVYELLPLHFAADTYTHLLYFSCSGVFLHLYFYFSQGSLISQKI